MTGRLRLLMSAYACEPGQGSEPGIGWNWVRQAARYHYVCVITRANNRPRLEAALEADPLPGVHFVYFDLPRWTCFWKRGPHGVRLYYYLWQFGAYLVARRLHRAAGFDLIHHVTLGTYWMPSFLALLPRPFLWGPVGGGESTPWGFRLRSGIGAELREVARDLVRLAGSLDPFVRLTARRASLALATSDCTAAAMRRLGCHRTTVLSQVGLPEEEVRELGEEAPPPGDRFRVASVGRLLDWKGFGLGLEAFAAFQRKYPDSEYWLIGEGPARGDLGRQARRLGIARNVVFCGGMPRGAALRKLAQCDVLLHPSLHDSGGWVCVEALALGRPVVCLDLGGPALIVGEDDGIKVPAVSRAQTIRDLDEALRRLAGDPGLRERMGVSGRLSVRERFTWSRKGNIWSLALANLRPPSR